MTRQQDRPILIIGAGLSGLTTARILTNHGVPNLVFEASNQDRSQGFSISLREWGYTALLDGLDGIPVTSLTRGVAPDRHIGGNGWIDQALRDNTSGELLVSPDPNNKQSIVRANRNALRDWIIDAGDEELDIRYGHKLKSFQGEVGDMVAEFGNGARYCGALIVAADGVHSTVRSKSLPKIVPEIVPVVVYHGEFVLARQDFDRLIKPLSGESNILAGVGDGFNTPITVCNRTASKVHMDWSYSRPVNGDNDSLYRPHVSTEEAKQIPEALLDEIATRNLAEPWSVFLNEEAMRKHHVFHWTSRCVFTKLEDVQQAAGSGVVFVGDSWHAMPIFGGEGGNHAIVDGVELANMLIEQRDICKGVSRYYDVAFRRCSDAVRRSRQRFYQLHRPMSEWREIIEKMAR